MWWTPSHTRKEDRVNPNQGAAVFLAISCFFGAVILNYWVQTEDIHGGLTSVTINNCNDSQQSATFPWSQWCNEPEKPYVNCTINAPTLDEVKMICDDLKFTWIIILIVGGIVGGTIS